MITHKQAATTAINFIMETFPGTNPRLEEMEASDDSAFWYITVSMFRGPTQASFADAMGNSSQYREYKTVKIDAETGTVKSVKIRQLTS